METAHVCPGTGKKGEGSKGGPPALAGTREYGIGSRRRVVWGVMEFGMSRRIKPKEKYVRISMKEIWRNLDGLQKFFKMVVLRSAFWI